MELFIGADALYWALLGLGSEHHPFLHFDIVAIIRHLSASNWGSFYCRGRGQGEHKLARGFTCHRRRGRFIDCANRVLMPGRSRLSSTGNGQAVDEEIDI